jgi:ABC-type uncharacterized transport system permease subunit
VSVDRSQAGRWPAYASFFTRALTAHLAYVSAVWVNFFAMAVSFAFTLLVWRYAKAGSADASRFFAYLTLAFALNFTLNTAFEKHVGERIREGLIATDLLRPVDYTWLFFFQSASDAAFQLLFSLVVVGLGALYLGSAMAPASVGALGLAGLSACLAFWVQFHLGFLFVQMVFATHSNYGPGTLRMLFHIALSGLFAPIDAYPPAFQRLALLLPFRHTIYTPVAIYQGRVTGAELWQALGSQLLWGLALFVVSRASFNFIRRHLSIQGG